LHHTLLRFGEAHLLLLEQALTGDGLDLLGDEGLGHIGREELSGPDLLAAHTSGLVRRFAENVGLDAGATGHDIAGTVGAPDGRVLALVECLAADAAVSHDKRVLYDVD